MWLASVFVDCKRCGARVWEYESEMGAGMIDVSSGLGIGVVDVGWKLSM